MIYFDIIASGSKSGNAYIVDDGETKLLLECGVHIKKIREACNWKLSDFAGCLITHEHKDHSGYAHKVAEYGVPLYASAGTIDAAGIFAIVMSSHKQRRIGSFTVLPFDARHDAAEPLNWLLQSDHGGKMVFITDSAYCPYRFKGLTDIAIETNYSREILNERMARGEITEGDKPRSVYNHMSLDYAIDFLLDHNLSTVENIYLLHLSRDNADKHHFVRSVKLITGKNVIAWEGE